MYIYLYTIIWIDAVYNMLCLDISTDLEHHKVIVSVSPVQKSYELGSQVTLRCIAPQSYGNFVLPRFYYRWFSTRSENLRNTYSSTGSSSYSFTLHTNYPKSADYYCDIYRNDQFLGSGKTVITIKGNIIYINNFVKYQCLLNHWMKLIIYLLFCRYFTELKF